MPVPTTIYNASIAIRGRRHTFVQMSLTANRYEKGQMKSEFICFF